MNILIRADGGSGIGLGHIMRTLAIAETLTENHNIKYVCLDEVEYLAGVSVIEDRGIEVIKINKDNEINQINNLVGDFIIIDKYSVDESYLEEIGRRFRLMYIDDNNLLSYYPVDLLLNHNLYADRLEYNTKDSTIKLIGSKFTLIRDEFMKLKKIEIHREPKSILITLGGSDDGNLTAEIIDELKNINMVINVVVGPGFIYKNELLSIKKENVNIHYNPNMSLLMSNIDIAISACGSTINELYYMGIPTIGIVVADNQKNLAEYMEERECLILSNTDDLIESMKKLNFEKRKKLSTNMELLLDGMGVFRIKENIEKYDIYNI